MQMPDVPINVPMDDPEADTEWNDILRQHGIIPEKAATSPAEHVIEEAVERARQVAHQNRLEGLDEEALAELEDDEQEEEEAEFLAGYRRRRMAELGRTARACRYEQVFHLQKPDYAREVSEASSSSPSSHGGTHVLVLLTSSHGVNTESALLMDVWTELSRRFGHVKFCQMKAALCIEGYPDKHTPTVLVYKDGDIKKQLVTLGELGGARTRARVQQHIERLLVDVGAVDQADARLLQRGPEREDGSAIAEHEKEEEDSDWD